jgi:hypothetical protein
MKGLVSTIDDRPQFLPEQLFETAQIPQVPDDIQNRLLSFNLGHSSPGFLIFRSVSSLDKPM